MITDAILLVLGSIVSFIGGLLPDGANVIPESLSSLGADLAERAAPLNKFFPVHELFLQVEILFSYWLPAILVYQIVFWVYKHLPVVGRG